MNRLRTISACALAAWSFFSAARGDGPIPIAAIERSTPVDFQQEVLPALTKSCLACHNAATSEADLVLETPQTILRGGASGPAVVAGNSAESLLLKVASHAAEPLMPPADNEVDARALDSRQLGLLKRWIDEGAKGEVTAATAIEWQALPPGMNPIYAATLTPDAQVAACSRANQIFIYNVASGQLLTRLTDPALVSSGVYAKQGVAHLDLVQSLAFSPDGQLLASGGFREVKLWRRPQNARLAEAAAAAPIVALAASADGKWAATGLASGAIQLWDASSLADPKTLLAHTAPVKGLAFTADGSKLVSGSDDQRICLWNVADGTALAQVETPAPVTALVALPDGAQVASGHADALVRRWTLPAAADAAIAPAGELSGHAGAVVALAACAADGGQLVSGGEDGTVRHWKLADASLIRAIEHGAALTAVAFRGDGRQIATAGADNLVKLWNAADGQPWASPDKQPLAEMKGDARIQFRVAQLNRGVAAATAKLADDEKAVADAEAKIIESSKTVAATQTAKEEAAKALAEKQAAVQAPTEAKAAADKELADGTAASTAAAEQSTMAAAAAEQEKENAELAKAAEAAKKAADDAAAQVKELEKKVADAKAALDKATQEATAAQAAHTAADQAAAAAVAAVKKSVNAVPPAQQQVEASKAALAAVEQQADEAKVAAAAAEKPFRTLAYSVDGTLLAAAGDNQLVRTWASDTATPVDTFEGHPSAARGVALLADGRVLSAADAGLVVWNPAAAWQLERTIGGPADPAVFVGRVTALAFSPDGKLLAGGGGEPSRSGDLKIINVADGSTHRAIADAHSDTVFGLEFSPDGKYLASSAADRFVKVFHLADGALARSFEGHTHHVLDVGWKADGKVLASSGADNVIKVWDFLTGDQLRTVPGFGKEVTSLVFVGTTPNVVASSGDQTARLVNTDDGKVVRNYSGPADFMYAADTSADGRIAIGGGQDGKLFVWLVDDGQLLKSFAAPLEQTGSVAQAEGN